MSNGNGRGGKISTDDPAEKAVLQLIRDVLRRPRRRPVRIIITIQGSDIHLDEGTPRGKFKHGPLGD